MIDFPKFKARMLNLKVQLKAGENQKGQIASAGKLATMAEINALFEEDLTDPSTGWCKKLEFEAEGGKVVATIYSKRVQGFDADFAGFIYEFKDVSID